MTCHGDDPRLSIGRGVVTSLLAGLLLLSLAGCESTTSGATASSSPTVIASSASPEPSATGVAPSWSQSTAAAGTTAEAAPGVADDVKAADDTAVAVLATLAIKGRAPKTGYTRDEFGARWADVDRNGCDTRNDILARDLTGVTFKEGTRDCVVLKGTLEEPYTATRISFVRGQDTSNTVQIDHVVALSDAWQKGAQKLDEDTRREFANDQLNLLAVDGPANMGKGDGDAATWLPANRQFRCQYVARQVAVKAKYSLWVTQAEHDAIARVLSSCPDEPLPTDTTISTVTVTSTAAPSATEPATTTSAPKAAAPATTSAPKATRKATSSSVYFKNCTAAREAGAAPVHTGDPGYGKHLDRDGDGVGCE